MAKKGPRHRLLIYHQLGKRWRASPLLISVMAFGLYVLAWLYNAGMLQGFNDPVLERLWRNRALVAGLIGLSLMLYILIVFVARSYVEIRPRALRIRGGMVTQDISYGRFNQLRLVSIAGQFPADELKAHDYALLEPYYDDVATAIEMRSWPNLPLKRLWHHMMFTPSGNNLLLIVEDPMRLNQQIDAALAARHSRLKKKSGYKDPIDRAMED